MSNGFFSVSRRHLNHFMDSVDFLKIIKLTEGHFASMKERKSYYYNSDSDVKGSIDLFVCGVV